MASIEGFLSGKSSQHSPCPGCCCPRFCRGCLGSKKRLNVTTFHVYQKIESLKGRRTIAVFVAWKVLGQRTQSQPLFRPPFLNRILVVVMRLNDPSPWDRYWRSLSRASERFLTCLKYHRPSVHYQTKFGTNPCLAKRGRGGGGASHRSEKSEAQCVHRAMGYCMMKLLGHRPHMSRK